MLSDSEDEDVLSAVEQQAMARLRGQIDSGGGRSTAASSSQVAVRRVSGNGGSVAVGAAPAVSAATAMATPSQRAQSTTSSMSKREIEALQRLYDMTSNAAGVGPVVELRIDPADGNIYEYSDFTDFYGEDAAAHWASATHLNAATLASLLRSADGVAGGSDSRAAGGGDVAGAGAAPAASRVSAGRSDDDGASLLAQSHSSLSSSLSSLSSSSVASPSVAVASPSPSSSLALAWPTSTTVAGSPSSSSLALTTTPDGTGTGTATTSSRVVNPSLVASVVDDITLLRDLACQLRQERKQRRLQMEAFDPDSLQLLRGHADGERDSSLGGSVLDFAAPWEAVHSVTAHNGSVTCLALALGGTMLISGSDSGEIRMWLLVPQQPTDQGEFGGRGGGGGEGEGGGGGRAAPAPDSSELLLQCDAAIKCLECLGRASPLLAVATAASDSDGGGGGSGGRGGGSSGNEIAIWDVVRRVHVRVLRGHSDAVGCLVCAASFGASANSSALLISGSEDKTIRVWETNSGTCLRTMRGHHDSVWSLCCPSSSSSTASGGGGGGGVASGRGAAAAAALSAQAPSSTSWSSSSSTGSFSCVVSGSWDCTIRVWDFASGR
jgi:WD40 repeat protein